MHSSRMRTAHSSSRHGGLHTTPWPDPPQFSPWVWAWTRSPSSSSLGVGLDQIHLNFPLGCGPGPDPLQLSPWVWAWTRSPQLLPWVWTLGSPMARSPLGVGLETCKACWDTPSPLKQACPGADTPQDQTTQPPGTRHPPPL